VGVGSWTVGISVGSRISGEKVAVGVGRGAGVGWLQAASEITTRSRVNVMMTFFIRFPFVP